MAIQKRGGVQNPFRRGGGPRGNLPTHFGAGGYKSAHAAGSPLWRLGKVAAVLMAGGLALYALSGESSSSNAPGGKLRDIEAASKRFDSENSHSRSQHHATMEEDHLLAAKKELELNGEHHIKSENDAKARIAPDTNQHQNLVQPDHGNTHGIKTDKESQATHGVIKTANGQSHSQSYGDDNKNHVGKSENGKSKTVAGDTITSGQTHHVSENENDKNNPKDRDSQEETPADDKVSNHEIIDSKKDDENNKSKLPEVASKADKNSKADKKEHEGSKDSVPGHQTSPPGKDDSGESAKVETLPAASVPPKSETSNVTGDTEVQSDTSATTPLVTPEKQIMSNDTVAVDSSSKISTTSANSLGANTSDAAISEAAVNSASGTKPIETGDHGKITVEGSLTKSDGEDNALEIVDKEDKAVEVVDKDDKAVEVIDDEDKAVEVMDKDGKIFEVMPDDNEDTKKAEMEKEAQVDPDEEDKAVEVMDKDGKILEIVPNDNENAKKGKAEKEAEVEAADENFQPLDKMVNSKTSPADKPADAKIE